VSRIDTEIVMPHEKIDTPESKTGSTQLACDIPGSCALVALMPPASSPERMTAA
jgi:hypothetical protein